LWRVGLGRHRSGSGMTSASGGGRQDAISSMAGQTYRQAQIKRFGARYPGAKINLGVVNRNDIIWKRHWRR
jgi:hypothetical protein